MKSRNGFTLVELLVVIGVIAILISLLLPTLSGARRSAQTAQCGSNLKQVYMAMAAYRRDFRDVIAPPVNGGLWEKPAGTMLGPYNGDAYWGVAYIRYIAAKSTGDILPDGSGTKVVGRAGGEAMAPVRKIFRCPSMIWMDPDGIFTGGAYSDIDQPATYGLNQFVAPRYSSVLSRWIPNTWSKMKRPSEIIVTQDAVEHKLDGNGDVLTNYTASEVSSGASRGRIQWTLQPRNLTQWRVQGGASYAFEKAIDEYYRHNKSANILWMDGSVRGFARVDRMNGRNVPLRWYSGTDDNLIVVGP